MNDSQKLLPCPFCGGEAQRNDELTKGVEGAVACTDCGAATFASWWNTRHDAAAQWVPVPQLPGTDGQYLCTLNIWNDEIEKLRGEVQRYERMMNRVADIRGFSWHMLRRRENNQDEWLVSDKGLVLGPFSTALEAFESLEV